MINFCSMTKSTQTTLMKSDSVLYFRIKIIPLIVLPVISLATACGIMLSPTSTVLAHAIHNGAIFPKVNALASYRCQCPHSVREFALVIVHHKWNLWLYVNQMQVAASSRSACEDNSMSKPGITLGKVDSQELSYSLYVTAMAVLWNFLRPYIFPSSEFTGPHQAFSHWCKPLCQPTTGTSLLLASHRQNFDQTITISFYSWLICLHGYLNTSLCRGTSHYTHTVRHYTGVGQERLEYWWSIMPPSKSQLLKLWGLSTVFPFMLII